MLGKANYVAHLMRENNNTRYYGYLHQMNHIKRRFKQTLAKLSKSKQEKEKEHKKENEEENEIDFIYIIKNKINSLDLIDDKKINIKFNKKGTPVFKLPQFMQTA